MYPEEIQKYIDDRGGILKAEEILFITDTKRHPQLNHIKYDPESNMYEMWDEYGNYHHFKAVIMKD